METLLTITGDDAQELVRMVLEVAQADRGLPISVAVVDVSGDPLYVRRMDGTSVDSFWIAFNKARSALRASKDTVEFGHNIHLPEEPSAVDPVRWVPKPAHEHRADDNRRTVNPSFVSWAGGVPLKVNGVLAGGLAISGRAELDDHKLADHVRTVWQRQFIPRTA